MDIADRINNKEYILILKKNLYTSFLHSGQINLAEEMKESITDLKVSIEHDREVQKIEAARSGRKTWKEDAWKYFLVSAGTAIVVLVVGYFLDNI